jgi:hypothetical protein
MFLAALHILALVLGTLSEDAKVVLSGRDGTQLEGWLAPAPDGLIGLRSEDFLETLEILPDRVVALDFEVTEEAQEVLEGQVIVELRGGDLLRGRLVGVSPEAWSFDAEGLGRVKLPVERILSIESLASSAVVFHGPNGLVGWEQLGRDDVLWIAAPGKLVSLAAGAKVGRDIGLDEPRQVDLELAWDAEPRFRIGLGSKSPKALRNHTIILEVWGKTLVGWSDAHKDLELVELATGLEKAGHLALHFRTEETEVVFLDDAGEELGRLPLRKRPGANLVLVNDGDSLELNSLLVVDSTHDVEVRRLDASEVLGFDVERRIFTTTAGDISESSVLGVDFATEVADAFSEDSTEQAEDEKSPERMLLTYADGRRLRGRFVRLSEAGLELVPDWKEESVSAGLDGLVSVHVAEPLRVGRRRSAKSFLVASTGEIAGKLDSIEADGAIVWRPDIAEGVATLDPEEVRRVVLNRKSAYFVSRRKWPHRLHLRSGDVFRCKLESLGEDVAMVSSPFGGAHAIPNELIKAVVFDSRAMERFTTLLTAESKPDQGFGWGTPFEPRRETSEGFDPSSLERALALPRKYKRRAFEHLLLARTGDFLRTRGVSWSPAGVSFGRRGGEVRLVPEERLAALVWLDPEIPADAEPDAPAKGERSVRVVLDSNTQVTLRLSGVQGDLLFGTSPLLGELSIRLDEILAIELSGDHTVVPEPFMDWALHPMKEPFPDDTEASTATVAVGDPAPETHGKDLDGEELSLSDYRGQVVLLDFWAHW